MKVHGRVDANHREVVAALRAMGATVQSLANIGCGCPDLLVGFQGRNYLLEIKDGSKAPSRRVLTADEVGWHRRWQGSVVVVDSVDAALAAVFWCKPKEAK